MFRISKYIFLYCFFYILYEAGIFSSSHNYVVVDKELSPLTNHRTDQYGGNLVNRSKMLLDIFQKIRASLPNIILGVRIPGEDHPRQFYYEVLIEKIC